MTASLARAPLAALAVAGLLASALALWWRPLGSVAALALVAALWTRHRVAALVCAALALRYLANDPAWPALPPFREALAGPLLRAIPEPDASIAVGSLLGGRGVLPKEVFEAFTRTGTNHLLAVSGFNITLAAAALGFALRPLGARVAALGVVVSALAFAVVAGLGPSVSRAAAMACAATLGTLLGRPGSGLNALGAAVLLLLLVTPDAIADVGFLLSVSATLGLVLAARPLEERLRGPSWLRAQLAATLAASLASLPVVAAVFGRVSLVSPLANLAVAPLVPPLMTLSGASMLLGHISEPAAALPAWLTFLCARLLRAIVQLFAALPFAMVASPFAAPLAFAAVLAPLAVLGRRRLRALRLEAVRFPVRSIPFAPVGVAALALAVALAPRALPQPGARVVALDVGQGDAYLVEVAHARILIDGGPEPRRVLRALGEVLPFSARRLDAVFLTHAHADHAAGLAAVLERYDVRLAVEPRGMDEGDVAQVWREAVARHGVPLRAVGRGERVRVGDLSVDVLAPFDDAADPLPNLVLRVRAGALTALFLGDATERGQADLLLWPAELAAAVYVPPHHGAATPHAQALARAAAPRVALVSVGAGNRYGHPTPDTLRALDGVPLFRTDRDGTLEVTLDGSTLRCRTRAAAFLGAWSGWLSRAPPCVRARAAPRTRRGRGRGRSGLALAPSESRRTPRRDPPVGARGELGRDPHGRAVRRPLRGGG